MDPSDFANAFSGSSEEDKVDQFQVSTLKLVLRQLGHTAKSVAALSRELDRSFDFDWFNTAGYTPCWVTATRCFKYNFQSLFTARCSRNHAIISMWEEAVQDMVEQGYAREDCVVCIFKCTGIGRLIATNAYLPDVLPRLVVGLDESRRFSIIKFEGFFKRFRSEEEKCLIEH